MLENKTIIFQKERSFNEFIPDTFAFLKTHWKPYFLYILIYAGPFMLLSSYYGAKADIKVSNLKNPTDLNETLTYILQLLEFKCAILFRFLGEIILKAISFGYIILYIQKQPITLNSIGSFFNKNIFLVFSATFFSYFLLSLGFMLYILPGLFLFGPLSLYVFDKIEKKENARITLTRCILLSKTSYVISYGIILILTIGTYALNLILNTLIPVSSHSYIVGNSIISTLYSVFCGFTSITISMLYYTLHSKISNQKIS